MLFYGLIIKVKILTMDWLFIDFFCYQSMRDGNRFRNSHLKNPRPKPVSLWNQSGEHFFQWKILLNPYPSRKFIFYQKTDEFPALIHVKARANKIL